jgi:GT2 family glycosyltransferase
MGAPTVSVIVPTFERASALERTLAALCALDYPAELLELIVVDDGSRDATRDAVSRFPHVRYVRQPNGGVAKARNTGARLATGDFLVFVDDDIIVARDNIARHLHVHANHDQCIVAGHCEFDPEVRTALRQSAFGRFRLRAEDVWNEDHAIRGGTSSQVRTLTAPTPNFSISRQLFWKLGGFDERFPVGAEDQDLCWRARSQGAVIIQDYDIRTIHNDQHRDLQALCRREERGAIGLVCLTRKHPEFPVPPALRLNGPVKRSDSVRIVVRKLSRAALSQAPSLWIAHRIVAGMEKLRPEGGWPLFFLYRAVTGLYVFRGIRRGYRVTSADPWRVAHRIG